MKDSNLGLFLLLEQIELDRCDLIDLLLEFEASNFKPISKHVRLLSMNYISLSELSFSIKEYFLLKKILLL
jgi:hypothetical protein